MWKLTQANCRNTVAGKRLLTAGGSSPVLQIWKRHIINPKADPVIRTDTRLGCHQFRGKKAHKVNWNFRKLSHHYRLHLTTTWPENHDRFKSFMLDRQIRRKQKLSCNVHWHFRWTTWNNVNFPEKLINPKWRTTAVAATRCCFVVRQTKVVLKHIHSYWYMAKVRI